MARGLFAAEPSSSSPAYRKVEAIGTRFCSTGADVNVWVVFWIPDQLIMIESLHNETDLKSNSNTMSAGAYPRKC
jgi:hypothetical protein